MEGKIYFFTLLFLDSIGEDGKFLSLEMFQKIIFVYYNWLFVEMDVGLSEVRILFYDIILLHNWWTGIFQVIADV